MKNIFLVSLLVLSIAGCKEDDKDPLKENSAIQAKEQIQAQNENTEYWTNKLLDDLEKRHRFINAVVGESLKQQAKIGALSLVDDHSFPVGVAGIIRRERLHRSGRSQSSGDKGAR